MWMKTLHVGYSVNEQLLLILDLVIEEIYVMLQKFINMGHTGCRSISVNDHNK